MAVVSSDEIRARFADAMSAMYRQEVSLYADLLEIVAGINAADPTADDRLAREYHGAIRLGTAEELATMRRLFAVMGMLPVGYYDLSVAGIPVHSTAFRPVYGASLARSPFRMFTSLLRIDLIADEALRAEAAALLARRRIFPDRLLHLVDRAERARGIDAADADAFIAAALEVFRWQAQAPVDRATYDRLLAAHRLVADIVCFHAPHINHLTPRILDIDAAQAEMRARGMAAKGVIEGPPRRAVPILLRQTSFAALDEPIRFADGTTGRHTARFGEIEQRGIALTPKGRALYDRLLDAARDGDPAGYAARLEQAFAAFPDDLDTLRRDGLAYFTYRRLAPAPLPAPVDLDASVASGDVAATPIVYEDFLPVSAAGIFHSNLGPGEPPVYRAAAAQAAFEDALGTPVVDPFSLYAVEESRSIAALSR